MQEHSVTIYFEYNKENLRPLHRLAEELKRVLNSNKVGSYDGHEMALNYNDGIIFLSGQNAEVLYKTVKPTLMSVNFMKGATAKLRFGAFEAGVYELDVTVNED